MKKFTKALIVAILGCFLVAGTAIALPIGTTLEGVFDSIALDGDNDVDVYNDMLGDFSDSYWNIGGTGTSAASFIIEIAGYAATNSFGIYDKTDYTNKVELFSGDDTTSDQIAVSIYTDGQVVVADLTDQTFSFGDFGGTTFGYYLDVAATGDIYYSDTDLNADGFDMRAVIGESVDIFWTPYTIKEHLWRPTQKQLFGKKSSKSITTEEINQIYDVINKAVGERTGIHVPFPSQETNF